MFASVSGSWDYIKTSKGPRQFTQMYSYSKSISITPQMSSSLGIRYTKSYTGSMWSDYLVPTASLNIVNDIFVLGLSGSASRRRTIGTPALWTNSWSSDLSFPWLTRKGWANLNLNYGESYSYDEGSPKRVDSISRNWALTLSRNFWEKLSVNYNYSGSWSKDKLTDGRSLSQSHLISYSFSDKWGRFWFGLDGQLYHTRNVQKVRAHEGRAVFPVTVKWRWEVSPSGLFLEEGNVALVEVGDAGLDEIAFFVDYFVRQEVPAAVKWTIEVSDDGVDWITVADGVSLPYTFSSTLFGGYIRLTVKDIADESPRLKDPRFVGYRIVKGKKKVASYVTKRTSYRIGGNVGCNISDFTRVSYNTSYGRNLPVPGDPSYDFSQSLSLGWYKYKWFLFNTNLSQTINGKKGGKKRESDVWGLSVNSQLLDTLSLTSGYTYSISKVDGRRESSSKSLYLSLDAQVYPDLSVKWSNNLNTAGKSRSYSSNVNIAARLKPNLTTIFNYIYNKNWGKVSSWSHREVISLSWRVSDVFSVSTLESYYWDSSKVEKFTYSVSAGIILTDKIQTNLGINGERGENRTISYYTTVFWNISSHLSLRFSYRGTREEKGENPWSWTLSVSANF